MIMFILMGVVADQSRHWPNTRNQVE